MTHSPSLDRLIYFLCEDDDKAYQDIAWDIHCFKQVHINLEKVLKSEFTGKTRAEFEEWKETMIKNHRTAICAYENLSYKDKEWAL